VRALGRASRSDGEAALDPHHPVRQRLSKRTGASTDRSGPGSLERVGVAGEGGCPARRWT
jgi:hypothetical protein